MAFGGLAAFFALLCCVPSGWMLPLSTSVAHSLCTARGKGALFGCIPSENEDLLVVSQSRSRAAGFLGAVLVRWCVAVARNAGTGMCFSA